MVNDALLSITFGSGFLEYSRATPNQFNFSAVHNQKYEAPNDDGMYAFVNKLPNESSVLHVRALDHTPDDDSSGYMYYVRVGIEDSVLFNSTVNNLHIGSSYEFSAYLANAVRKDRTDSIKPNISFQVRDAAPNSNTLARYDTGNIDEYEQMTWSKYGLSFNASSCSVVLLMISCIGGGRGNDLAIDNIELRVSSTAHSGFYSSGL